MNPYGVGGWGLVGLVVAGGLRVALNRSSFLQGKPAPPVILEAMTVALFVALALRIGLKPEVVAYSWLAAAGVPLSVIDWVTRHLPTKLVWSTGLIMAVLFGLASLVKHDASPLLRSAVGMLGLLGFYGALYLFRSGQLGGGDVRLGGVLGFALGWSGWSAILTGTLLGWLTAALTLIVLRVVWPLEPNRNVPLGPFLIFGAFVVVLMAKAY